MPYIPIAKARSFTALSIKSKRYDGYALVSLEGMATKGETYIEKKEFNEGSRYVAYNRTLFI